MESDGCTLWPDLWYRACCVDHDQSYFDGLVYLWTHIVLGWCIVTSAFDPITVALGVIIGPLVTIGTTLWWLVRHRGRRDPYSSSRTKQPK